MVARLRRQDGFGLVELLIAIVVLNIAIFAMFSAFNAGTFSILRAGRTATGTVVAERQLELYRAMLWRNIGLHPTLITAAASDSVHVSDAAAADAQTANASCTTSAPECQPIQSTVTGPDGSSYRIDTYVSTLAAVTGGRSVKRVTVVVRRADDLAAAPLARLQTTFDRSTGCVFASTTDPC